jgi:RNA polymerase sigma factor (sigma-70 family)
MQSVSSDSPDLADLTAARRRIQSSWIGLIASGGRHRDEALRKLLDAYDARIIRLCRWQFGLSREEAQDVWQDVLIGICKRAAEFRAGADPAPWILNMVRSRAIDLLRRPWRRHEAPLVDDVVDSKEQLVEQTAPASQADASAGVDRCVQQALQAFAVRHSEEAHLIAMRDLEGWDIPQVAAFLGRTETATRRYLSDLRRKFKPFVEPCLDLLIS